MASVSPASQRLLGSRSGKHCTSYCNTSSCAARGVCWPFRLASCSSLGNPHQPLSQDTQREDNLDKTLRLRFSGNDVLIAFAVLFFYLLVRITQTNHGMDFPEELADPDLIRALIKASRLLPRLLPGYVGRVG